MVLCRSAPDVSQFTVGDSQHLHFHSRSLIGLVASEKELWNLHHIYGASFRNLIDFAHRPNVYDRMVNEEMRKLLPLDFTKLLINCNEPTGGSRLLISTRPLPTDRTGPETTVASTYILKRICERVLGNRVEEMRELYEALRNNQATAPAARMVFEYRVHQFLREKRVIKLLPILYVSSGRGSNAIYETYTTNTSVAGKRFTLPKSEELPFTDELDTPLDVGTYYRPQSNNFPTIDS